MTYFDEVMADSPLAYYRLDESSGSQAGSITGGGNLDYLNSPTLSAAGALTTEPDDTAVSFNGTNQSAIGSSTTGLDTGDSASIEAWFKTTSNVYDQVIVARWSNTDSSQRWLLETSVGTVRLYVHGTTIDYPNLASSETFNDGQWHHVVAALSPNAAVLYVDGVQRATTSWSGSLNTGAPLGIGSDTETPTPNLFFNGSIDEVAIYGTTLSLERVQAHYAAATGGTVEPPPITYGSNLEFANYGYGYGGQSVATWTAPAAAVPPSHPTPTPLRRVHHVLPAPTLVDGRPT